MGWQRDILEVVEQQAVRRTLYPRSVTSREGNPNLPVPVIGVDGIAVKQSLPWLYSLYKGLFRDMAQLGCLEPVATAENDVYGAVLNVQRSTDMRYEAHVDSNPIEGLLYVTDHPSGTGGELVVSNNPRAGSIAEIEIDCSIVFPAAGNLVFFDARRWPHYVRPLKDPAGIRVVVAMNFYTPSCPESVRPSDLSRHLQGYDSTEPPASLASRSA
jgi:hypothetical protein